jgi:signal transduction histidine kinase
VVIAGDAGQLARALGNLLDNACKFTPEGGEIEVRLRGEAQWAEIAVQDSGIGIPEEDLSQIFQRFHRARNAAGYGGSGLGLAFACAIAGGHGGEIRAERVERGARFILRLPRYRP